MSGDYELPPLPEGMSTDPLGRLHGSSETLVQSKPSDSSKPAPEAKKPTSREVVEELHLRMDQAIDRRIADHVMHGITIQQQVKTRAMELLAMKHRLNRAQRNLVDFYHVDLQRKNPPGWLDAEMLRLSE